MSEQSTDLRERIGTVVDDVVGEIVNAETPEEEVRRRREGIDRILALLPSTCDADVLDLTTGEYVACQLEAGHGPHTGLNVEGERVTWQDCKPWVAQEGSSWDCEAGLCPKCKGIGCKCECHTIQSRALAPQQKEGQDG